MNGVVVKYVKDDGTETFCLTFQCALVNKDFLSKGEVLEILLNKMDYAIKHSEECIEWIE